jgi:hypothetical protein
MGRHSEARNVDADDPDPIDLIRQQPERHTGRGGNAEVGDHDGVVTLGVGHLVHGVADVFEEFPRHQGL